jgi:peroxiredoxin Q/BCP
MRKLIPICFAVMLAATAGAVYGEARMVKVGDTAPEFSLIADSGDTVILSAYRGKRSVVLVFYPGDQTPVCTKQLCEIRDRYAEFEKRNTVVFGINPAGRESHAAFVKKQGYRFPLLADTDKKTVAAYGVKGILTKRTVFIVAMDGTVVYAKRGKPPVEEILENIPETKGE